MAAAPRKSWQSWSQVRTAHQHCARPPATRPRSPALLLQSPASPRTTLLAFLMCAMWHRPIPRCCSRGASSARPLQHSPRTKTVPFCCSSVASRPSLSCALRMNRSTMVCLQQYLCACAASCAAHCLRVTGGDGWVSREFTEVTYADAAATPGRKLLRLPLAGRFTVFVGMLYHMPWLLRLQVLWCVLLAIFIPSYRARVKPLFLDFMNDLGLHGLNEIMLEFSARNIGRVMRVLSNPDNYPVLVNCSHGKDRTGLIIALVLLVCKVPPAKVVRDYALSDKFGQTIEARAKFSHVPELDVDAFCRAKPMTMKWTIEYIYRVHGSVQAYLQSIDVDTEIRERIRSCLRDANPEHDQEKDLLPGVF
eukprot:m.111169 g.111169  ORF g.111169 m.111169 type:complete len:364 (+) comp9365_c0_seq1:4961-6052(+)